MVLGERQKHLEVLRATWTQPWSPSQGCLETASRAAIGNGSNRPKRSFMAGSLKDWLEVARPFFCA